MTATVIVWVSRPEEESMRVSMTLVLLALAAFGGPALGTDRIVQYEHFTSAG